MKHRYADHVLVGLLLKVAPLSSGMRRHEGPALNINKYGRQQVIFVVLPRGCGVLEWATRVCLAQELKGLCLQPYSC